MAVARMIGIGADPYNIQGKGSWIGKDETYVETPSVGRFAYTGG